jgi:hypothetical protein
MNLVKSILVLLLSFFIVGCATTIDLSEELESKISKNDNLVILYSENTASEYYKEIYRSLRRFGYSIDETNEDMLDISTNEIELEAGSLYLTLDIFIEENQETGGSIAYLRSYGCSPNGVVGPYGNCEESQIRSIWKGTAGSFPKFFFAETVKISENLPYDRVDYTNE